MIFRTRQIQNRCKISGITVLVKPDGKSIRQLRVQTHLWKWLIILRKKLKIYTSKLIKSNQFAYQQNKGPIDAMIKLHEIKAANDIAIKIDIKQALDSVNREVIFKRINDEINQQTAQLFKIFWTSGWANIKNKNKSFYKRDYENVPQVTSLEDSPVSNWYWDSTSGTSEGILADCICRWCSDHLKLLHCWENPRYNFRRL